MDTRHQNQTNVYYERFLIRPPGDTWCREDVEEERGQEGREEREVQSAHLNTHCSW